MNNQQKWYKKLVIAALTMSIGLSAGVAGVPHAAEAAAASSSRADQVLAIGQHYLGVPYQFDAKRGQTQTFDCSSFTQYVFKQIGINLPGSSRQQAL